MIGVDVKLMALRALWRALFATALINVPLVGIVFVFIAYPVFAVFPELKQTGPDIVYLYASALLVGIKSWIIFYVYYFCIIFSFSLFFNYRGKGVS